MKHTTVSHQFDSHLECHIVDRSWSKLLAIGLFAALAAPSGLRASTDVLFSSYDPIAGSVSDYSDVDLNSYGSSSLSIDVTADADAADDYDSNATSSADSYISGGSGADAYGSAGPSNNAQSRGYIHAYDIEQDEDGNWIAATVTNTQSGTSYNVNFGSGSVEIGASGSASGDEVTAQDYGAVNY